MLVAGGLPSLPSGLILAWPPHHSNCSPDRVSCLCSASVPSVAVSWAPPHTPVLGVLVSLPGGTNYTQGFLGHFFPLGNTLKSNSNDFEPIFKTPVSLLYNLTQNTHIDHLSTVVLNEFEPLQKSSLPSVEVNRP